MASQKAVKTDERLELESVARGLGVKGFLPKDDEVLKTKIAEAQVIDTEEVETVVAKVEVKRKTAPRMNVAGIGRDDRAALVERLEREDPECKYLFQAGTVTNRELAAKGLERTDYSLKNDIVCRTIKDSYEEMLNVRNEGSYEAMGRIDGGTGIVGKFDASPKSPQMAES
jgi:hypothetical protein